jgi:RHH-type transcriptional regulator, proline utilization regulon repressor / proline dehydrogenase / delta 1-pyrroline-5-carboxylate dehydrogenase
VPHVVRRRADERGRLSDGVARNDAALTAGFPLRIDATAERVIARLPHGNVHGNGDVIGAVVGSQRFGGGLYGTGPEAGGNALQPAGEEG